MGRLQSTLFMKCQERDVVNVKAVIMEGAFQPCSEGQFPEY